MKGTIVVVLVLICCPLSAQETLPFERHRPDEMDDLLVEQIIPTPAFPAPGEEVQVAMVVRNRGLRAVEELELALFDDLGGSSTVRVEIAAGAAIEVEVGWTAPEQSRRVTLAAVVDPGRERLEIDVADNYATRELLVAPPPPQGTELSLTHPALIDRDESGAGLAVTAGGDIVAPLAVPLVVRTADRVVAVELVALEPGAPARPVTIRLADSLLHSPLAVELNPRFRSAEPNPEDNLLSIDPRPTVDLRVEALSITALRPEAERSREVTITARVVNGGELDVEEPFRVTLYPGALGDEGFVPLSLIIPGLAAGDSTYLNHRLALPDFVHAFQALAEVDARQQIAEEIEDNNIATREFSNPLPNVGRWVGIGPRKITTGLGAVGRLTAIAIARSAPATMLVGARGSGIWKTADGGSTWAPIADSLPTLEIASLAVDPQNASRYYAFTRAGFFASTNGGKSWSRRSSRISKASSGGRSGELLVHPTNSNHLYAATLEDVSTSTDGGKTWTPSLCRGGPTGLVMHPTSPTVLYAAVRGKGIFHTTNGGLPTRQCSDGWTPLTNGLPNAPACQGKASDAAACIASITLALCRDKPKTLYAGYSRRSGFELYRTTDGGAHWTRRSKPNFDGLFNDVLGVDATNPDVVYITGVRFYRSTDGGKNFTELGGPHVDHHGFANHPTQAGTIFSLNDGGIYKSTNWGGGWTFIGDGLANVEMYDLAVAATNPQLVIAGTQDNGTVRSDGKSTAWQEILGGDGATVAISPTDAQLMYAMHQYAGEIKRSEHGGASGSWECIGCGLPVGCVCLNFAWILDPSQPKRLIAPCNSLWHTLGPSCSQCPNLDKRTAGNPQGWTNIHTPPAAAGRPARAAIDSSVDLYFSGTSSGRLYAGKGGTGWQLLLTRNGRRVTDIELDPSDPRTVYVGFSGGGGDRIVRLRRSSATPTAAAVTAAAIGGGLPAQRRIRAVAVDRLRRFTVYAGTDRGVFRGRSADSGATWTWEAYSNGMPAADVVDLELHPGTGVLRAATFGRSAYEVYTYKPPLFLEIAPWERKSLPGGTAAYTVRLFNTGMNPLSVDLSVSGLEGPRTSFSSTLVTLSAGRQKTITLSIQLDRCAAEGARTFSVIASDTTDPLLFRSDQARLVIAVPKRSLAANLSEPDDSPAKATKISLAATTTQTVKQSLSGRTLHRAEDVDAYLLRYQSDKTAECIGASGKKAWGSFPSAFSPQYTPGGLAIHVDEEFCRPMDVEVRYSDAKTTYRKYRTREPIYLDCPTDDFGDRKLYLFVKRKEKDQVRYDLKVSFGNWIISLGKPLVDPGWLRYPVPPELEIFDPTQRYGDPAHFLRVFERDRLIAAEHRSMLEEGDARHLAGQVFRFAGRGEEAEGRFQESREIFAAAGDLAAQGDALRSLGELYTEQGRFDEAVASLQEAVELHHATGSVWHLARDHLALGDAFSAAGELARGLEMYDLALAGEGLSAPEDHAAVLMKQFDALLALDREEGAMACLVLLENLSSEVEAPELSGEVAQRAATLRERLGREQYLGLKIGLEYQAERILQVAIQ